MEGKLKTDSWKKLYNITDVNKYCDIFYSKLVNAISIVTSINTTNDKNKRIKEWMTKTFLQSACNK